MSELKPCAHCGDSDYLTIAHCNGPDENPEQAYVVCDFTKGGCGASGGARYGEEQAIAAWNARAERTCKRILYKPTKVLVCSECGAGMPKQLDKYCYLNYCPNCGARVIGGVGA